MVAALLNYRAIYGIAKFFGHSSEERHFLPKEHGCNQVKTAVGNIETAIEGF